MESEIKLVMYIFGPLILILVFSCWLIKLGGREESWKKVCFSLNPKHGLASQPWFWVVMLTPLAWFLLFGLCVWRGYDVALTRQGFSEFIAISTLPILLLSLSVPVTALVAHLHSTEQTAKQIQKNEHEHFYLHRREFVYYFESIGATRVYGVYEFKYNIAPRIHGRLFEGRAEGGVPVLMKSKVDDLINKLETAEDRLGVLLGADDSSDFKKVYFDFCSSIWDLVMVFGVRDLQLLIERDGVEFVWGSKVFRNIGLGAGHAAAAYECMRVYLINLVYFSGYTEGMFRMDELSKRAKSLDELRLSGGLEKRFEKLLTTMPRNERAR